MMKTKRAATFALLLGGTFFFRPTLSAVDAGPIKIHGSVSATASYSDTWDYSGGSAGETSLNRADLILNGVRRFDNGLRVGAQVYAYKYAGFSDVTLDWANLDYSYKQWLGVRVGRNKSPLGLYNEIQDLDALRTFVNLPIAFYPRHYRAVTTSIDGLTVYGNGEVGKVGSFEYELFYGRKDGISEAAPILRGFSGLVHWKSWEFQRPGYGGAFTWNAPIDGLRFTYTYSMYPKDELKGLLAPKSEMLPSQIGTANTVDALFGAGTWDKSGLFAGTVADITNLRASYRTISAEFARGKWTLAAEYKLFDIRDGSAYLPAFVRLGKPATTPYTPVLIEIHYGQVSYQATSKLGLGFYYCYELKDRTTPGSKSNPLKYQHDYALAASYQITNWLVLKVEGHRMVGLSRLNTEGAQNVLSPTSNKDWNFFAFQAVTSF